MLLTFIPGTASYPQNTGTIFSKNQSIKEALKFVNTPPEKLEKTIGSVKGRLVSGELLRFANVLADIRSKNDVESFVKLLSAKSDKNKNTSDFIKGIIDNISKGEFLYKKESDHLFVTSEIVTDEEYKRMNNAYISMPEKPGVKLIFYHYNLQSNFLIGTTFYLVREQSDYKITFPVSKNYQAPANSNAH